MAANEIYRLTLRQRMFDQECHNVLYFKFLTSNATPQGLRGTIADTFWAQLSPIQSADVEYLAARSRGIVPYSDTEETVAAATVQGILAPPSLPALNAAVISLRTGLPGKSKRGRFYLCGIPGDQLSGNGLVGGYVTSIQTAFAALQNLYGAGGSNNDYQWGVFSPKLGGTLYTPTPPKQPYYSDPFNAAGFVPISSVVARPIVASFVSRKQGRGI
jgi:hypothetical protein